MTTIEHHLVGAYLDEVETGLRDIEISGSDRAEVLAGLRDHVAEALAEQAGDRAPTDAEIRDVLAALGSPDDVVRGYAEHTSGRDERRHGASAAHGSKGGTSGTSGRAWHDRRWVPWLVAILQVITWVVSYVSIVLAGGLAGPTRSVGRGPDAGRVVDWGRAADQALSGLVAAAIPWWAILGTFVLASRLWSRRERHLHLALPAIAVLTPVVVSVLVVLLGESRLAEAAGWVALAAVLLWLILALRGLTRSALDRA